MSNEIVFVLEPDVGRITVEISQASEQTVGHLARDLGTRISVNCAKPDAKERNLPVLQPKPTGIGQLEPDPSSIWLYRLYHGSVVDGPGRRSVIQVSGCSLRCSGCLVPETHDLENGERVSISSIVSEVLDRQNEHDGVTILGGEPFDQPESVAELVSRLKNHGLHVTIYSGYTIEQLIQRKQPATDCILTHIDILIDGPFVRELRDAPGEYRGSRNQRLIDLQRRSNVVGLRPLHVMTRDVDEFISPVPR